jgi:hypothetical protein
VNIYICEYFEEMAFMERRKIVCVIHSRSANKTIVVGLWSGAID